MAEKTPNENAVRQYAAAHKVHYKTKDLGEALELYANVMNEYPDSREANYSRAQIQNIAESVVPKQELLEAQKKMIRSLLGKEAEPFITPPQAAPLVSRELTT